MIRKGLATMATITPKANKRFRIVSKLALCVGVACSPFPYASAQQAGQSGLTVSAQARAEAITQTVQAETTGLADLNTLNITPQINFAYQSGKVSGSFSGSVTHLQRDNDVLEQEETYGEYQYNGTVEIIDNALFLRANGSLSYFNALANNFLINDFNNDQGQLLKTRSNTISGIANVQNNDWVRGNGTLSYSQIRSDQNEFQNGAALQTDAYTAQGSLRQGDTVDSVFWNLSGAFRKSVQLEQQNINNLNRGQGNFTTRQAIGNLDYVVIDNWALRLNAAHEANQIENLASEFQAARSFNSYGAGVTYRQSDNRFISVTYNTTDSDVESNDGVEFIGVDLAWAFSSRTSITGLYTRRFFGESANFSIRYNTRRFRSSFTYSEEVTSNAFLIADGDSNGLFFCPIGVTDIDSCFLPGTLDFEGEAGFNLVDFGSQNLEINDNVILRKSSNGQIGYSFSRLSISLFSNHAIETLLDSDAERRTISGGFNLTYQLGNFTNLVSRVSYADIFSRGGDGNTNGFFIAAGETQNVNASVGLNRQLGQNLTVDANFNYIEQSGDALVGIFGSEFRDRRFSIGITYRYN